MLGMPSAFMRIFVELRAAAALLSPCVRSKATFASLGVSSDLAESLASKGIAEPSSIQEFAIPPIAEGRSCALQSCTGSGKTLAYLLPALTLATRNRLKQQQQQQLQQEQQQPHAAASSLQVLLVAPSRELCMQILKVAQGLLPPHERHRAQQAIGGANPKRQAEALRRHRPLLVVGTPGRILDLIDSEALQLQRCPLLVLDEVDQLATSEFRAAIDRIARVVGSKLPGARQTVLASASLTEQLLGRVSQWCPGASPQYVSTAHQGVHPALAPAVASTPAENNGLHRPGTPFEGLSSSRPSSEGVGSIGKARLALPPLQHHLYVAAEAGQKLGKLHSCLVAMGIQRALVFAGSQKATIYIRQRLMEKRFPATVLHGGLSKLERTNVMSAFHRGDFRAMVVTDMASRGLDFPELDAVFNLGLPEDDLDYAHRSGRTSRLGGSQGQVISILSKDEVPRAEQISSRLGIQIQAAVVAFGQVLLRPFPQIGGSEVQAETTVVAEVSPPASSRGRISSESKSARTSRAKAAERGTWPPPPGGCDDDAGSAAPSGGVGDDEPMLQIEKGGRRRSRRALAPSIPPLSVRVSMSTGGAPFLRCK